MLNQQILDQDMFNLFEYSKDFRCNTNNAKKPKNQRMKQALYRDIWDKVHNHIEEKLIDMSWEIRAELES